VFDPSPAILGDDMMRFQTPACAVGILGLLLPGRATAQSATTAAIGGTVKDTTAAVRPGVTVEAASPALIERVRAVVTDDKGEYKIVDLRPGTYSITFTLAGFSTLKRERRRADCRLHRDSEHRHESRGAWPALV
jgi:Carboxypeptidase regulatory-like domain